MWFFRDPVRFQAEQDAIAALAATAPWLESLEWRIGEYARIVCEARLQVAGRVFEAQLIYGSAFPDTPPSVRPCDPTERWSGHQYGNGELCLEYGPDNWQPEMTGAMMLESTFRLLSGEASAVAGEPAPPVPSRHALTLGQQLRGELFRLTYTDAFAQRLDALAVPVAARFCLRVAEDDWTAFPLGLSDANGDDWTDVSAPTPEVVGGVAVPGYCIPRLDADQALVLTGARAFRASLLGEVEEGEELPRREMFLVRHAGVWRGFSTWMDADVVREWSLVPPGGGTRLDAEYVALRELKVGLVGCGSVGAKVAAMLTRAGVRRFVLVDDELLQVAKLVRHELDWADVGQHKSTALKQRILRLQPDADVRVQRLRLGGQEAAGAADGLVFALSQCDLLIDATASPTTFNFLAAAARKGDKPLLWVEVLAGGLGGVIVRSRPGQDPPPPMARAALAQWYAEQDTPFPATATTPYGFELEGQTLIADDAEVSVMAAHLARLAIDTALQRSPSLFPVSAYVIGLRPGWIFTQPFDVWPVDLGPAPPAPDNPIDPEVQQRAIATLADLLTKFDAQTPAA